MIGQSRLNIGDLVRPYWNSRHYIIIKVTRPLVAGKRKSYCRVSNGLGRFEFDQSGLILVRKAKKNDLAKQIEHR